ncbi:MAG: ribonuclease P protein component [Alphaproteobacteria bacterium]
MLLYSSLPNRSDFLRVRHQGVSAGRAGLILQLAIQPSVFSKRHNYKPHTHRVGVTATKKLGNAVIRNRAKRRLRMIANEFIMQEPAARKYLFDMVLIARHQTLDHDWQRLGGEACSALRQCLDKLSKQTNSNPS